jgi:hypothetical protein
MSDYMKRKRKCGICGEFEDNVGQCEDFPEQKAHCAWCHTQLTGEK